MNAPRLPLMLVWLSLSAATACDPQKSDWGLDAIRAMPTPPDDPTLGCGVQLPVDPAPAARAACQFPAGTRAPVSLGIDESLRAQLPIRHIVIVMKENRSFDHLLGPLHDLGRPDVEAVPPTYSNPDSQGNAVFPSHPTTTCIVHDPGHQSESVLNSIDNGTMDGFVINAAETTGTDGHFVMGEYEQTDFPFYYWLANQFAIADHHFAPMASGTFGNRDFLLFGTNAGVVDTGIEFPPPNTPSIMQLLMNRGFTWGAYSDGDPASGALDWGPSDPGVHSLQEFYDALDAGTLPNLSLVDGRDYIDDDHPFADIQTGEAWTKAIYDHAIASPQWPLMAIIWTYDEAGGFADHVPPPHRLSGDADPGAVHADGTAHPAGGDLAVGEAQLRIARLARSHGDPPVHRDRVRSARADGARRQQRRAPRPVRLLVRPRSLGAGGARRGHRRLCRPGAAGRALNRRRRRYGGTLLGLTE